MVNLGEEARRVGCRLVDRARGAPFERHLNELDCAQNLTSEELRDWQRKRLYDLLCHARDTTRFYRPLIPTSFSPADSWEVLSGLPIVSKGTIDADSDALFSRTFSRARSWAGATSGTTGLSVAFWMDRYRRSRVLAELAYFGRWAGYEIGVRHMFLRPAFPDPPKSALHLWPKNQILVDTGRLDNTRLDAIVGLLTDSRAKVLFGYPWTLQALAAHIHRSRQGDSPPPADLRSIIAVGGALPRESRMDIEEALGCPVFERYSASETGTIAGECEMHRLHLNIGSLYAELMPHETIRISASGEPRTLILTDLFNYAMPFLRYNMKDVVVLDDGPCTCGRSSPLIGAVYGRTMDQITSPEGEWVDPMCFGNLLRNIPSIRRFQFVQETLNSYVVRVVPCDGFGSQTVSEIVQRHRRFLGPSANIQVLPVDEIPALPSGKRPLVISNLRRGEPID